MTHTPDTAEVRQLLIVEDDEAFARTLARSFERRGYVVVHARNLEEVEALLEEGDGPRPATRWST